MVGEVRIVYRLTAVLGGLCLFLSACATPDTGPRTVPGAAQTRIGAMQPSVPDGSGRPVGNAGVITEEASGVQTFPILDPAIVPGPVRIALLLPLQSETLGNAAAAVRAGFMAAAEREANESIRVETIESGEAAHDVLASYGNASQSVDILVGPLSRSGVTAIVHSGAVTKPTIALTQMETPDETKVVLPPNMLIIGLSAEDEARQMAGLVHARKPVGTAIVLTTPTAWQTRAARAFADRWTQLGNPSELMELDISAQGAYLGANGLIALQKRIQAEKPPFIFSALDALQTRQLRMLIGQDIPVYGTSQLNASTMAQWVAAEPLPEMNGVRFVDLPWLLQADHPAVMSYSNAATANDPQRGANLERLYALGIDAFRIAKEIASGQMRFQIDGVTGKLRISVNKESGRFERIETPAVYREGRAAPVGAMQ